MRIFVSEYVCGGAWPETRIETSLAREGRAMLTALVADLSRIPGAQVVTTWDARLGKSTLKNCDVRVVETAADEASLYRNLCLQCDVVWVIAPETGNVLRDRKGLFDSVMMVTRAKTWPTFIGSKLPTIALCTDKLALSEYLRAQGISTPKTLELETVAYQPPVIDGKKSPTSELLVEPPIVIKPRDGAGSQETFLVCSDKEFATVWKKCDGRREAFISQPFVAGKALSVALLIAEDGSIREVLPVAEQHLSDNGRFRYLGGRIPADISAESAIAVQRLAEKACRVLPGLTGYVGCDIVLPVDRPLEPVLIEINPRLTSSYLGYRTLTDDNIPARLLDANTPPLRWNAKPVTFSV